MRKGTFFNPASFCLTEWTSAVLCQTVHALPHLWTAVSQLNPFGSSFLFCWICTSFKKSKSHRDPSMCKAYGSCGPHCKRAFRNKIDMVRVRLKFSCGLHYSEPGAVGKKRTLVVFSYKFEKKISWSESVHERLEVSSRFWGKEFGVWR